MTVKDDVLGVNYLMRQPITEDECDRVVHALGLANYEVKKRPPEKGSARARSDRWKADTTRCNECQLDARSLTPDERCRCSIIESKKLPDD